MPNENPQNPIEGKGKEMVPERGLPFDDLQVILEEEIQIPLEENSGPENKISPEAESFDSLKKNESNLEVTKKHVETSEATPITETFTNEVLTVSQEKSNFKPDPEAFFDFPEAEREALIGIAANSFSSEATIWDFSKEEIDLLTRDADKAFNLEDLPEEKSKAIPPKDLITEGAKDGGMSTHREDDLKEFGQLFSGSALEAPASSHPIDLIKTSESSEPDVNKEMLNLLINDEDMTDLWKRANQAQKDVNTYITTLYIAKPLLNRIERARELLMVGKENYENAERHINEVEYRVQLTLQLEEWSRSVILPMFLYLGVIFVLLISLLLVLAENLFAQESTYAIYLIGSMIWGGIGGIIGALLALIKHFSQEQDFSKQHSWWYYASPFMGIAMGAFIYLFVSAGVLSITAGGGISSPTIIYILAGLSGYQQNVFTNLVKRMLKSLEIGN